MYGKQLSDARYKRCLELFAAIHEELGEANNHGGHEMVIPFMAGLPAVEGVLFTLAYRH